VANRCELVDLQARPTLTVRTRTALEQLPHVLGPAWGAVLASAGKAGEAPSDAPFVAYHNWDMQDLDVEIGFTFERTVEGDGEVSAGEIAEGKAAQCIHVGPYDQLRTTYEALEAWIAERGLRHVGPAYEFYLNDPQDATPAELRTRVVLPVG
jgi:effector-binding domain-containing protein